jgi:hypothetical protein
MRRFANATCAEELPGKAEHRLTKLDPYIDLVNQPWNEGVTNAEAITAELRTLGFKGDAQTVRRYLKPFRLPGASRSHPDPDRRKPAPTAPAVSKPRAISRALLTHPDRMTEADAQIVHSATAGCARLERLQQHVRSFAKMMAQRRGQETARLAGGGRGRRPAGTAELRRRHPPRPFRRHQRVDPGTQLRCCRGRRHTGQAAQARRLRTSQIRSQSPDTRCRLNERHVIIARAELHDRRHYREALASEAPRPAYPGPAEDGAACCRARPLRRLGWRRRSRGGRRSR